MSEIYNSTHPTITRDLVSQGHLIMSVTFRISCSNDARAVGLGSSVG